WAWKARVLHTAGERLAEAEDGYRRAIDLSRSYPWCWAQLGLLYQEELGRFRDAEAAYRKAIEENPEYAWAWGQLGQLLGTELRRVAEAEEALRRSIEIDPEDDWDWAQLGELLSHQPGRDRKSTRLNSSHVKNSYAVFCLKEKNTSPR